jgi:hypothetical protein
MVKINRSSLPQGVVITKPEDYRSNPVLQLILSDFKNKCYICEDHDITRLDIDHLQSKAHFPEKEFEWENLFLSCAYCNENIKRTYYDDIIDCTKIDPENFISLSISVDDKTVTVQKEGDTAGIEQTVALLSKVYNGIGKTMTDAGSGNLRNRVIKELVGFQSTIDRWSSETDDALRDSYWIDIQTTIQRSAPFAAFKRGIVRNSAELRYEFGDAL